MKAYGLHTGTRDFAAFHPEATMIAVSVSFVNKCRWMRAIAAFNAALSFRQ